MNNLLKSAIAGALALGATSAFAVGIPSSGSSDLILYVDAVTSSGASTGVYALDTGITLSSLMPGPYNGTTTQYNTTFPGTSKTIQESPTLQTFLSSHPGTTFEWTLEGGQYTNPGYAAGSFTGAQNSNTVAPGSALAVFTSPAIDGAKPHVPTSSTNALQNFLNGYESDLQSGGLQALLTSTETGSATESPGATSKYNFLGAPDLAAVGSTAIGLYGFTGNGINGGTIQTYTLGSATLSSAGVLTLTAGNTPVPLPPALWLFGSGVMGLVGVSRRRKAAAAA